MEVEKRLVDICITIKKIGRLLLILGDRVDWARGRKDRHHADELVCVDNIFFFFCCVIGSSPAKSLILYLSPIEEQIRQRSWPISIQSISKKVKTDGVSESGTLWLDRSQPLKQSHLPREPEEHGE
jgi:hypothetical protein